MLLTSIGQTVILSMGLEWTDVNYEMILVHLISFDSNDTIAQMVVWMHELYFGVINEIIALWRAWR